jgi:hypothetical protein
MNAAPKERPILMSASMVKATLRPDSPKTMTRRVIMPQLPADAWGPELHPLDYSVKELRGKLSWFVPLNDDLWPCNRKDAIRCPYGLPGDRLWVRESCFYSEQANSWLYRADSAEPLIEQLKAISLEHWEDYWENVPIPPRWCPAIHMPRRASRITLEITGIKVERLKDISDEDAMAEGVDQGLLYGQFVYRDYAARPDAEPESSCFDTPLLSFKSLWDSINAKRDKGRFAWTANPWVWAISFRRVTP